MTEIRINEPTPSALRGILRWLGDHVGGRFRERPEDPLPPTRLVASRLYLPGDRLKGFLESTGGSQIDALGPTGLLPPTAPAMWKTALALELLRVRGFPFPVKGLVVMDAESVFLRPLPASETASMCLEVAEVEAGGAGVRVAIRSEVRNGRGLLCQEGLTNLLFLSGNRSDGRPREGPESDGKRWKEVERWRVGPGLARRFARISTDFNPVHLSTLTARALGYRRPILHGACIQAMTAHAIIGSHLRGDPQKLRKLKIRFRAPFWLPGEAVLAVEERSSPGPTAFRILPGPGATRSIAEGHFVGDAGQG